MAEHPPGEPPGANGAVTDDGFPVRHPEVRYEPDRIDSGSVVGGGIGLALLAALGVALSVPIYLWVSARERPDKETDLPPAAVDADRLPPEPRLEFIEDLRDNRFSFFPPRAEKYTEEARRQLRDGTLDRKTGRYTRLPIDVAIHDLAGKLPTRSGKGGPAGHTAPPENFLLKRPSKASAGRVETGGQ